MKQGTLGGSRNTDGNVPNVNFNNSKVNINWYNPDNANDNLRTREIVSKIKKEPSATGLLSYSRRYLIQPFVILDISCIDFSK